MRTNVVIYGSAAGDLSSAKDIDVAFTGDQAEAARLVEDWARKNGVTHLPVDWHQQADDGTGTLLLPAPCAERSRTVVLTRRTTVAWRAHWGLGSYVRAYAPGELRTALPESARLAVTPAAERELEYVDGLTALRSAVRKSTDPRLAARLLEEAYGPLLGRLLAQDPAPTPAALETLLAGSPVGAGQVVLQLTQGEAPCLPYSSGEDVEGLLYSSCPACQAGEEDMRHRLIAADLAAMDLLELATRRLVALTTTTGDGPSAPPTTGDMADAIHQAYPHGPMREEHLLLVTAMAGQAANLLLAAAGQAGRDPLVLLAQLREQTVQDAADLLGG